MAATAACTVRPGIRESDWDRGAVDARTATRERAVALPPYPQETDLIEFLVGPTGSHRYFIDGKNLSVGADGVLRYTVVVMASGGARNVAYEGMSCKTYEKRTYALGQSGGKWAEAKRSEWEPIRTGRINEYQGVLYKDFFCPDRQPVRDKEAALRGLRQALYESGPPRRN
jgi:hypothetical protein